MDSSQPFHEPLRATVLRNILITLAAATVLSLATSHSPHPVRWPIAIAVMLWPTFGGHWIELWFLNWLTPRLAPSAAMRRIARLITWFVGGAVLLLGMTLTPRIFGEQRLARWPAWWVGGLAFIGVEFLVHVALQARGRPSLFNERG